MGNQAAWYNGLKKAGEVIMDDKSLAQIRGLKKYGVTVNDPSYFIQQVRSYGYHEIVDQYLTHFTSRNQPVDFNAIADLYHFDQRLKNIMMVSLQLFEQSFKAALAEAFPVDYQGELFQEAYRLSDGRVIRRGDLKSRIRRIRQNYLEPVAGYRQLHKDQITLWVLVKEMSFGVATNAFFLLASATQARVLSRVFKTPVTLSDFERILTDIRLFRHRAAHNYRLLEIKSAGRSLYQLVLQDLTLLNNQDPVRYARENFQRIINHYLVNHPEEEYLVEKLTGGIGWTNDR